MYRVIIVDDERMLRSLVKRIVDWKSLDLEVVGEASSGIEAINIMDDLQPDIALVDIRMPFMDGITFAKHMTSHYPDLKIIIMSAYQDFEYARQCMSLGITKYLLKPISKEEIFEALQSTIEQLPQKRKEMEDDPKNIRINKYIQYIEENYQNPELNLSYIAKQFGFHPVYFSKKFKEKTGKGFAEYLMEYRMNIACEYAKQGELMYRTAELVGIPDSIYFGKCFKKYKNTSYSDYRKDFV